MNSPSLIISLERFATVLPVLVRDVPASDARWKPPDGAWSILEVLGHLADEEVEDFRTRLELTLRDPMLPWPPIDPERSAVERRYNEADLQAVLDRFLVERQQSISWLKSLPAETNWSASSSHSTAGTLHAGDLLASWAAHDLLHLRQITKRLFQLTQRDAGTFETHYAGEWKA
jgi:hypothetical protein